MISALADAGAVLGEERYRDAAVAAAEFVLRDLRDDQGRLLRTYNAGRAHLNAYLEDHAYLLEALLTLYEATFDPRWFGEARALADTIIDRFADAERGGFFSTAERPRGADRPPQGARGHADPGGRLGRRVRPAAARAGSPARPLRGGGARPDPARARAGAAASVRRSGTCCRRSTSWSPTCARSRSSATTVGRWSGRARGVPAPSRAGRWTRRRRAAARRGGRRSKAARRPTCASISRAGGR